MSGTAYRSSHCAGVEYSVKTSDKGGIAVNSNFAVLILSIISSFNLFGRDGGCGRGKEEVEEEVDEVDEVEEVEEVVMMIVG